MYSLTKRSLRSSGAPDGDSAAPPPSGDAYAQRQRLLQGSATLEDGSRRLQDSHRLALETEDIGAGILQDLQGQREQIEHSRDTVSLVLTSSMGRTRISTARLAHLHA